MSFRFDEKFSARRDDVYLEEYLNKCVKDLKDIDYKYGYPKEKEKYKAFVKAVHNYALEFGLDNEKYAFALMALWHLEGSHFDRDTTFFKMLMSENIPALMKFSNIQARTAQWADKINNMEVK